MFKAGDVVVCVHPHGRLTEGKEYVVTRNTDHVVSIIHDEGREGSFFNYRFKLAVPKMQVGALVVFVDEGAFEGLHRVEKIYVNGRIKLVGIPYQYSPKNFKIVGIGEPLPPVAPPVVKENPSLLDRLVEKTGPNAGTCSFARRFEDNKEDHFDIRAVCHAALGYSDFVVKEIALNVVAHLDGRRSKHDVNYKRYVDYITNRSPWAECFIRKPLDEVMASGIYLNVEKPISQVVCAAIALRVGSELPRGRCLDNFVNAIDLGYSENVAFMALTSLGVNGAIEDMDGWHNVVSFGLDTEGWAKFFNENAFHVNLNEPAYNAEPVHGYKVQQALAPISDLSIGSEVFKASEQVTITRGDWGSTQRIVVGATKEERLINVCNLMNKYIK